MSCCDKVEYDVFPLCLDVNTSIKEVLEDLEPTIGKAIDTKAIIKPTNIQIETEVTLTNSSRIGFFIWLKSAPTIFKLNVPIYGIFKEFEVSLQNKELIEKYEYSTLSKMTLLFKVEENINLTELICEEANCERIENE